MKTRRLISTAAALALVAGPAMAQDDNPVEIFDLPANTAYFTMKFEDVDNPGGADYQALTPTVGGTFALGRNARLAVRLSRQQIVEPIWHGRKTTLTVGIAGRF